MKNLIIFSIVIISMILVSCDKTTTYNNSNEYYIAQEVDILEAISTADLKRINKEYNFEIYTMLRDNVGSRDSYYSFKYVKEYSDIQSVIEREFEKADSVLTLYKKLDKFETFKRYR